MTCKNATLPEILELSPRLEDADPGVRRLALIELADLELPEALPLLVAALRGDPDPGVRGEAARLLEAWEEDAVVDALCAALADPLPAVADAAAQSLGELKEPAAGRRLLPWLGHADAFVRASVSPRPWASPAMVNPPRSANTRDGEWMPSVSLNQSIAAPPTRWTA
ncbi:HEAT repeat domain-containing protein, partial [Pseudomonas aeruginosa]|nr:HEAT repeat domain-containing protein [Pseudomonas aeruginosa]